MYRRSQQRMSDSEYQHQDGGYHHDDSHHGDDQHHSDQEQTSVMSPPAAESTPATSGSEGEGTPVDEAEGSATEAGREAEAGFFNRLAGLPVSKVAIEQLSSLYERAHQRKLLAMGLDAGMMSFRMAGKVTSPFAKVLPVGSMSHLACRQLDNIEYYIPVIKSEPQEMLAAAKSMPGNTVRAVKDRSVNTVIAVKDTGVNTVKAVTGTGINTVKAVKDTGVKSVIAVKDTGVNTVKAVKDTSISTVCGIKDYAVETISPTVNRAKKVKDFSTETVSSATTYTRGKISETYEGVKPMETVSGYYNSMKCGVSDRYQGLRDGVSRGYDGTITTMSGVKTSVVGGCVAAKDEIYNYTAETLNPTVTRCKNAKEYSVAKLGDSKTYVCERYSGLRGRVNVGEAVGSLRVVRAVRDTRLGQALGNSINHWVDRAAASLDHYLPPLPALRDTDADSDEDVTEEEVDRELNPADADAGTWTKTMCLMWNLGQRLTARTLNRLQPVTSRIKSVKMTVSEYKDSTSDKLSCYYASVRDSTASKASATRHYAGETYTTGRDWTTGAYRGVTDRLWSAMSGGWDLTKRGTTKSFTMTKEGVYTTVHTVHKGLVSAKDTSVDVYSSGRSKLGSSFAYCKDTVLEGWDNLLIKMTSGKQKKLE